MASPLQSLSLALLFVAIGWVPVQAGSYDTQINTWKAQDALNPPPDDGIVFVGSSSIRRWERLAEDLSSYDVIQRGFGGARFTDLNCYVSDIILPYDPAAIVLLAGKNDIASGATPTDVFLDYLTFVNLVHTGQNQGRPPIPIFFIGITPTPTLWPLWPLEDQVNSQIAAYAQTDPALYYVDAPSIFLATGQPPDSTLFVADGVHLSQAGYDIWTAVLRPTLETFVPPTKTYTPNPLHPAIGERLLFDFGPSDPTNGNPTLSPDLNGNHWNNWHDVDAGIKILAGEHIGNLVDTTGAPTGIDLTLTGGFISYGKLNGGLLAPDPLLLGDFAIDTATEDYFLTNNEDSPGSLMLTGLDPSLSYQVRLFGTRRQAKRRVSQYTFTGCGIHVRGKLQAAGRNIGNDGMYDGNDDEILTLDRVIPNRYGQVFLDVLGLKERNGFLGILEITVQSGTHCRGSTF